MLKSIFEYYKTRRTTRGRDHVVKGAAFLKAARTAGRKSTLIKNAGASQLEEQQDDEAHLIKNARALKTRRTTEEGRTFSIIKTASVLQTSGSPSLFGADPLVGMVVNR